MVSLLYVPAGLVNMRSCSVYDNMRSGYILEVHEAGLGARMRLARGKTVVLSSQYKQDHDVFKSIELHNWRVHARGS